MDMVVSQNKRTQYGPKNTIVLIIWTPKKVPLILGNPHMGDDIRGVLWGSKGDTRSEDDSSHDFHHFTLQVCLLRTLNNDQGGGGPSQP